MVKINQIPTLTSYQQKFLAWQFDRRRSSSDGDKFTSVLAEAQVDLNPHQVDATLFAFKSPLSMDAVLADEVGLGKTIETALVISQQWAEDQTFSLEEELRSVKKQIKECEREFRKKADDHCRRRLQAEILSLQRSQRQKRQELFSLEDEIITRRDALIAAIDNSLDKKAEGNASLR